MRPILALLLLTSCSSGVPEQASGQLVVAFPGLTFQEPVDVQAPPDGSGRLFVVEQAGIIQVFSEQAPAPPTRFLDLRDRVVSGGERGLLGLAFHPRFPDSAYVYVNYTASSPLRTVLARFTLSPTNPDAADAASERILLEVPQPFANHNAGQLQFGPDGYLYMGLGDGGSGGDPQNNGQRLTTLLGSMLRLDVDGAGLPPDCGGPSARYTLPPDNPFVNRTDACSEIFAYGLRNPWRFSFGPTGTLYVADVGQGSWEEVDTLTAGGNYGWNRLEGTHCYNAGSCNAAGTILPVAEYPHDRTTGGFSITGGYVYTGSDASCAALRGKYLYGDYVSGNVWALESSSGHTTITPLVRNASISLSTFGVGGEGALYLADHGGGLLYRLDCAALPTHGTPAERTGMLYLSPPTPNPAHAYAEINVSAGTDARIRLTLFDATGRLVHAFDGLANGAHFQLKTNHLPSGAYLLRAQDATTSMTHWLVVAH